MRSPVPHEMRPDDACEYPERPKPPLFQPVNVRYHQPMKQEPLAPVDVVMLGTFAMWNLGTLQARALPFARAMQAHGLNTAIVTTPWDMPSEAGVLDIVDGVTVINTAAASARNPLPAIRQQVGWVNKLKPRLVHVMKPKGFGGMAARLLHNSLPIVVDSDDWEGDGGWNDAGNYSWPQRRVFQYQENDLLQRANVVTAASTFLAERTTSLRNGDDASVFLVENGLEAGWMNQLAAGRTSPPSVIDPPVIVLYSRFAEFGENWLPELADSLATRLKIPATLRVIGAVPQGTSLPDSVGPLNIECMGYVAKSQLPELLGSSTLAVYPYEDSLITRSKQSVKLLELMAAGCPVIGSDVGDIGHVLASSGVTLSGADPVRFATEVCALLDEPGRMDIMSSAATDRIQGQFGFDYLSSKLLDAYLAAGLSR